jgi:hypothetical protein
LLYECGKRLLIKKRVETAEMREFVGYECNLLDKERKEVRSELKIVGQLLQKLNDHVTRIMGRECQEFLMTVKKKYR